MKAIPILVFSLAICTEPLSAGPYLAGGVEASEEKWPWVTAVMDAGAPLESGLVCSGALVHPRFVLVAAHAVAGKAPADLNCIIGEHTLSGDSIRREIIDIVLHPEHELDRWNIQQADVALLRLRQAETAIQPASLLDVLDPLALVEPMDTTVMGWAATSAAGAMEAYRQELVMPTVSLDLANQRLSYNTLLKASHLPIGTDLMLEDACLGTSSAPVVIATPQGDQLAGLVSFGKGCQVRSWYRICSNIGFYRPWISSILWPAYTAWETENGGQGFFHDRNGDGIPNGLEYGLGHDLDPSPPHRGPVKWSFPSERADVTRFVQTGSTLRDWTPAEVSASTEGDMTIWEVEAGNGDGTAFFSRLGVQPGSSYVAVPKPLKLTKGYLGELIGPDEARGDNRLVRAYLLNGLPPAGDFALRIVPANFNPTIRIIDRETGATLSETATAQGSPGMLKFAALPNKQLVAEVEGTGIQGFGNYDLAFSGAPDPRITPLEIDELLNEPTKTVVLNVTNVGAGIFDFTVTPGQNWLRVDQTSGSLDSRQSAVIRATLDTANLARGTYSTTLDIAGTDGTMVSVPVTLRVLPPYPIIQVGQTIGELTSSDQPSTNRADLFPGITLTMDSYLFQATANTRHGITMASSAFDCYLYVYDAETGALLAEADDSGNGHRFNAAISIDLQKGRTYLIEATTYGPFITQRVTGPYQVIVVR